MIVLPGKCKCHDCDAHPRVMQKGKREKGEYWYCDKYEEIPEEILRGGKCKRIVRAD